MDNKIIYEAQLSYGINFPFIIFGIITVLLIVLLIVFRNKVDIGVKCLISLIIVFFLFIISCLVYSEVDAKLGVYNKYKAGEYSVVEGTIQNYTFNEDAFGDVKYDSFSIEEQYFSVPGFASCWGYPLKRVDGGVLEDGLSVRICYIPYKCENIIMKIEYLGKPEDGPIS